jgi:hypothetical protein
MFGVYDNLVFEDKELMADYEDKVWETIGCFVNKIAFAEYDRVIKLLFNFKKDVREFRLSGQSVTVKDYSMDVLLLEAGNANMSRDVHIDGDCRKPVRLEYTLSEMKDARASGFDFKEANIFAYESGDGVKVRKIDF